MAKAVTTTKKPATKAVAKTGGAALPAHLAKVKMTGAGVSTDAADNLIPMARVLQPLSPEVQKKGTNSIPGAEPGDILIKNAPNPIIKADDGFLFQPCYFDKGFVEWLPRSKGGGGGGGFVAMHKEEPKDTESRPNPENPEKTIRVRKSNGNLVVETRYHGGFIIADGEPPMPAVIPFSGSGHSVSKRWMMLMNKKVVDGAKVDSFAILYKFVTVHVERGGNNWFMFEVSDAGEEDANGLPTTRWVDSVEDYERGKALSDSLTTGARTFDASEAAPTEEADDKM